MNIFQSQFWFLRDLFWIFISLTIVSIGYKQASNWKKILAILVAVVVLVFLDPTFKTFKYSVYFYIGFCVHLLLEKNNNSYKDEKYVKFMLATFALFAFQCILMYIIPSRVFIYKINHIIMALSGSIGVFGILICGYNIVNVKIKSIVAGIGKKTLGIYAIHWCLLFALPVGAEFYKCLDSCNVYLSSTIVFVVWTIISIFIVDLIGRIPFLKSLLLG